jgi:oxaloacetate decarboxylase gamma subunit
MTTGITLMIIGMVTVFAVLLIIIMLSRCLIVFVNNIAPEETGKVSRVPDDIQEAINKAIFQITGGRGKIKEIKEV